MKSIKDVFDMLDLFYANKFLKSMIIVKPTEKENEAILKDEKDSIILIKK